MTDQFFAALKARLTELVQDLRYLHKPTGLLVAPQIIDIMLPRPTEAVAEADEYPFVRWLVYKGTFMRQGLLPFSVVLDAGIYTDGDSFDGNAAIMQLCVALGKIIEVPSLAMYRIDEPIRFAIGSPGPEDGNPGVQAHPYYHGRLFLDFLISTIRK
jgi:hypothetical protein